MEPSAILRVCSLFLGILISAYRKINGCRIASRKYLFSVILSAVLSAKGIHLYSHLNSLSPATFVTWGLTFFVQDVVLIILARILTQQDRGSFLRVLAASLAFLLCLNVLIMASANISFFIVTGAEIHWKQAKSFHRDPAGIRTLLYGSTGCIIAGSFILTISWILTPHAYNAVGALLSSLSSSVVWLLRGCRSPRDGSEAYEQIATDDLPGLKDDEDSEVSLLGTTNNDPTVQAGPTLRRRLVVLIPTVLFVLLRFIRPHESSYMYLSWALPLSPFTGENHETTVFNVNQMLGETPSWLANRTALGKPTSFSFLPEEPVEGFTDWYSQTVNSTFKHYNPKQDPLHISNLGSSILEPLRELLQSGSVDIKHVILIKLESTREDVFPLRRDSTVMDRVTESYDPDPIPQEVLERLANLTRASEFLSGHQSGFEEDGHVQRARGGISATNAITTGTYTLKSVPGTICGISPLVADFNREYNHHLYQPCLPHILDVLNAQTNDSSSADDYTTWPWESKWMQTVTDSYDRQADTTRLMGFKDSQVTTRETMQDPTTRHFPPKSEEVCLYGYPDTELRDYLRDVLTDAERDHKRVFLTHLTGTTHEPWGLPSHAYDELVGNYWGWGLRAKLNRYLNAIGFADRWLAEILTMLEEAGVADSTLLILAGDHGLTVPDDAGVTPYDNPHVGAFHVPLQLSHPKLPPIDIAEPVILLQVLPTILDLLVESSSLNAPSAVAASELLQTYEGQSLIRPLIQETPDGRQDWQFSVMNTGGSWLALRSAAHPYRLVVPLIADVEWRFTDLERDGKEERPLLEFDPGLLIDVVRESHGVDAAEWVREAAHVAQWFVGENWARWEWVAGEE